MHLPSFSSSEGQKYRIPAAYSRMHAQMRESGYFHRYSGPDYGNTKDAGSLNSSTGRSPGTGKDQTADEVARGGDGILI